LWKDTGNLEGSADSLLCDLMGRKASDAFAFEENVSAAWGKHAR
jgi:hypothetical protein